MSFLPFIVAIFFCGYIFFDAMAIISRASASAANRNAFGAAIEKIMNTLKRLSIFGYPPLLGVFIVKGDVEGIFSSIALSYLSGTLVLLLVLVWKKHFFIYFFKVVSVFSAGAGVFKSFSKVIFSKEKDVLSIDLNQFPNFSPLVLIKSQARLFFLASWIYFIFGASIFVVNLLAVSFSDYSPIILQSLGLVNGLGTLVLAFMVDPAISRFLDFQEKLGDMVDLVLLAQLVACLLYAPLFFFIAYLIG